MRRARKEHFDAVCFLSVSIGSAGDIVPQNETLDFLEHHFVLTVMSLNCLR